MSRVYNFSAGPAVLPEEVLKEAAAEMLDYKGTGMSVMEMSHRSKAFETIITEAEADLREIKKEYTNKGILFVAAAIGDDKENIERIYGDAFLEISDLTKLPFLLVKKIEKELKG